MKIIAAERCPMQCPAGGTATFNVQCTYTDKHEGPHSGWNAYRDGLMSTHVFPHPLGLIAIDVRHEQGYYAIVVAKSLLSVADQDVLSQALGAAFLQAARGIDMHGQRITNADAILDGLLRP